MFEILTKSVQQSRYNEYDFTKDIEKKKGKSESMKVT